MINLDLQKLIQALDADTRRDLESCAERCVIRGASQVLVEDLLLCLLERPEGLLERGLRDAEVDPGQLRNALQPLGGQSTSRNPVFAQELVQWLQEALLAANLDLGQSWVGEAALLLALLRNPLGHAGSRYQPLLARLNIERLKDFALSRHSDPAAPQPVRGDDSMLQRFTHDLTEQAREGRIDPVLCRDTEIGQMIDILARRRKNNPIVVGEAGVGKTALVEGLALRIAAGEVPPVLKDVRVLSLDLGLLQAGASVKGEFERRLTGVIDEVKAAPLPVILFIDEAHTLIGAGGNAGGSDAANLLKPACRWRNWPVSTTPALPASPLICRRAFAASSKRYRLWTGRCALPLPGLIAQMRPWAYFCWWAPVVWARPKPRGYWPTFCTAASAF